MGKQRDIDIIKSELGTPLCMKCLESIRLTRGDKLCTKIFTVVELDSMEKEFPIVAQRIRNNNYEAYFHSRCWDYLYDEWIGIEPVDFVSDKDVLIKKDVHIVTHM